MIFVVWSRWGLLVPGFAALAAFGGLLARRSMHVLSPAADAGCILLAGAFAGGALFLADRRIQEGSGHVYYDAQTDQPVVVEESSGHFMFVPLRWWAAILPAIGLVMAVLQLFATPPDAG